MKTFKTIFFLTTFILLLLSLLLLLSGCEEKAFKTNKIFAGNLTVNPETLNLGKSTYIKYCISCHGEKGDGKGFAAKGLVPPARDFTKGIFKFGRVESGGLPHDLDFFKIIKMGLPGTAMLPWDISDERMNAVVQYIKTFAPTVWEGADKVLGTATELTPDPYLNNDQQGIERGKEVYHLVGNCNACHRSYVSHQELSNLNLKINKTPIKEFSPLLYSVKLQDTEYGYKSTPPDFTWHFVRTGSTLNDLYIRIASGVGGTSMPGWKGILSEEDLWAVTHYVRYLVSFKDTKARHDFILKIEEIKK